MDSGTQAIFRTYGRSKEMVQNIRGRYRWVTIRRHVVTRKNWYIIFFEKWDEGAWQICAWQ